jgi:glycosyltransferase involved in cell wall biosynthesis
MQYEISVAISSIGRNSIFDVISSIASQIYQPMEIIVYFDCKVEDRPSEIFISQLESIWTGPVYVYFGSSNLGASCGYNLAISKCSGQLIALASDDDIWLPTKLLKQVRSYKPKSLVLTSAYFSGSRKEFVRPRHVIPDGIDPAKFVLERRTYPWTSKYYLPMSSALFSRDFIDIKFNSDLVFYEDFWWLHEAVLAGCRIIQIEDPLIICNISHARSGSRYKDGLEKFIEIFTPLGNCGRILKSHLPRSFVVSGDLSYLIRLWKRSKEFEKISWLDYLEFSWQVGLCLIVRSFYFIHRKLFRIAKET